jgi:hypothetical protein
MESWLVELLVGSNLGFNFVVLIRSRVACCVAAFCSLDSCVDYYFFGTRDRWPSNRSGPNEFLRQCSDGDRMDWL